MPWPREDGDLGRGDVAANGGARRHGSRLRIGRRSDAFGSGDRSQRRDRAGYIRADLQLRLNGAGSRSRMFQPLPDDIADAAMRAGDRLGGFAGRVLWREEVGSTNDIV